MMDAADHRCDSHALRMTISILRPLSSIVGSQMSMALRLDGSAGQQIGEMMAILSKSNNILT